MGHKSEHVRTHGGAGCSRNRCSRQGKGELMSELNLDANDHIRASRCIPENHGQNACHPQNIENPPATSCFSSPVLAHGAKPVPRPEHAPDDRPMTHHRDRRLLELH